MKKKMEHYTSVRCTVSCASKKKRKFTKFFGDDELEIIVDDGLLSNRLLMDPAYYTCTSHSANFINYLFIASLITNTRVFSVKILCSARKSIIVVTIFNLHLK